MGQRRLYEVLGEHPRVALTNEARIVDFLYFAAQLAGVAVDEVRDLRLEEPVRIRGVVRPAYTKLFAQVFAAHAPRILEDFHARLNGDADIAYWGDKLPTAEAACAALEAFPNGRLIAVIRDPRDYLCSVRSYTAAPSIRANHPYLERPLEEHCTHWRNVYDGIQRYLPATYLLRYEDLIADPEATVKSVLDHLGLDFDPACAAAIERPGSFETHGSSASPAASVARYKRELSPVECSAVEAICGEVMLRHGYAPANAKS